MTVDEIIQRLGGAQSAAAAIGVKRTTLLQWRSRGGVPPRHVPAVARALGVPAEQVWPALAPAPRQEAA